MKNVGGVKRGSGHLDHIKELVIQPDCWEEYYERFIFDKSCINPQGGKLSDELRHKFVTNTIIYDILQLKLPDKETSPMTTEFKQILNIVKKNLHQINRMIICNYEDKTILDSPYWKYVYELTDGFNGEIDIHDYLTDTVKYTPVNMNTLLEWLNTTVATHKNLYRLRRD